VEWRLDEAELVLTVLDDGLGFEPQRTARGGLGAMRRRAERLGGSLEIESTPGWGTCVEVRLRLHHAPTQPDETTPGVIGSLAERELDVLRLMSVGHRNRDIAAELHLSPHTVKFHVANIFDKLGVRSRAEAAAVAFSAGLQPGAVAFAA
jgi:DNA-binding CsgD family transcriptional regulator